MTTSLEQKRQMLEELDVIEDEISKRMQRNPLLWQSANSHNILGGKKRPLKETLLQQHEIKRFINQYQKLCENLQGKLQPVEPDLDPNLSKFDELYKELKEFHTKYPNRPIEFPSSIYAMHSSFTINGAGVEEAVDSKGKRRKLRRPILSSFAADLRLDKIFTDEEYFGNYLDLITFHQDWLNLPRNDLKLSYTEYLDIFNKLPYPNNFNLRIDKGSNQYFKYITSLADYLEQFYTKIQPLGKPHISISKIEADFFMKWSSDLKDDNQFKDNGKANKYQLKEDGSVQCLVCDKLFTKFTVYKGHLNSKKHLKNLEKSTDSVVSQNSPITKDDVEKVEKAEYVVKELSSLLSRKISDTRTNAERKKLLTDHERSLEQESLRKIEEEELFESSDNGDEDDSDHSDTETANYNNPLKLPLGVDGKPIPYWLFKLNGLGLEFSCEVCGNFVYQGRKSYITHFGETKHLNGLKCLGIDSSLIGIFKGISRIDDVMKLKERLNVETKKESNMLENIEEVEDEEGNVMSKRDYEDLKKQGLV